MQTKNQFTLTRKILYGIMFLTVALSSFSARNSVTVHAQNALPETPTHLPVKDVQVLYGPDCSSDAYGYNQDSSYFTDVLNLMGIPASQFALDAFMAWKPYENTTACWNPLATTYHVEWFPGGTGCTETIFNSVGVRNYSSKYCGELATARTLLFTGSGSSYKPIRDMLSQVSFNWQSIHDSIKLWVGSEAYATDITNKWQTLWNNRGGGSSCPSVSGEVRLYDLTNCGGDYTSAGGTGLWSMVSSFNDRAESIAIPSGWSARLYQNNNENSNESACFASTDLNLNDNTFANGGGVGNNATWIRVYDNTSCSGGVAIPPSPSLSSPGNSSNNPYDYNLNFQWNPSSGATEYLIEWWGGPYSAMQPCGWSSATSCQIGTVIAGNTYSWHVKARNSAGESNWSDIWTFTINTETSPDLVIESITASPPNPSLNQPITFTVRVKNQGTGNVTASFYVDFFVDNQPSTCPSDGITYWVVTSLAAGTTQDFTYTYAGFSTSGSHNIYAFADSYCYISESNKSNNIGTLTIQSGTDGVGTFVDVPNTHPYFNEIEILYANGFTAGCSSSPLMFCPEQIMDRAQSAVFMLRGNFGSGYLPVTPTHFFMDDWSNAVWAEGWAESMYIEGLTAGCSLSSLMFCPYDQLTNTQAAVFALRLRYGMAYLPPVSSGTVFADLADANFWGTGWAEQAYIDGLIPACGTDVNSGKPLFCPNNLVNRGFGAYIIVKAKNLTMP